MNPASGPVSFDALSGHTFSFYPAIRNIEHNEWTLERETWSEILVANTRSQQQLWIPRNHLGEISSSDSPVLIVGLNHELEFKAGAVWPFREKIVEMPGSRTPRETPPEGQPAASPVSPASAGSEAEWRIGRFVGGALVVGVVACLLVVLFVMEGAPNPLDWFRGDPTTADQRYLGLDGADGYHDVVIQAGKPEKEQWLTPEEAELQFQLLWYAGRSYAVVMMGSGRGDARYVGTIHVPSRRVLDSVRLSGGGSTASLLRNLPEF